MVNAVKEPPYHRLEAAGNTTLEKLRSKILRDILSVAGAGEGVVDEVVTILSKRCLLPRPKSLGQLLLLLASSARARETLGQRSYLGAASNPARFFSPSRSACSSSAASLGTARHPRLGW